MGNKFLQYFALTVAVIGAVFSCSLRQKTEAVLHIFLLSGNTIPQKGE